MPIVAFELQPGINTQKTQDLNRNGWSISQNIRWKDGLLQKLGGWKRISETPFVGICRGMHAWADLQGSPFLIIGTNERVQVYDGSIVDVTPVEETVNMVPAFATTAGSPVVTVTLSNHGEIADSWIYIQTAVSVGGLLLRGYYKVTPTDGDHYTITANKNATSTTSGGTVAIASMTAGSNTVSVTLPAHGLNVNDPFTIEIPLAIAGVTLTGEYLVSAVPSVDVFEFHHTAPATSTETKPQNGGQVRILDLLRSGLRTASSTGLYGSGLYGMGLYGVGNVGRFLVRAREWFFDIWGEDAIGNPTDGTLYLWRPPTATDNRMTPVAGAPTRINVSFVSMPEQIVVALGCETMGIFDPNLVRWCDVADYNDWVASAINQAGSFRISTGSKIVGGILASQQALIWTDLDLWSMRYVGPPFIFSFTKIASACGLIAPRAVWATTKGIIWMGANTFYIYDSGGVRPLRCAVWNKVFKDLNITQASKIHACSNADFSEVTFKFATNPSEEINHYVKISLNEADGNGEFLWDFGTTNETAWEDRSVIGPAIGADVNGLLQQHEVSNDADGQPMVSFAESGFFDLSNGQDIAFVDQVIPNAAISPGTVVQFLFTTKKTPNDQKPRMYGPFQMTGKTPYIHPRFRGREVAMRIGSDDLGSFWRMGLIRYRGAPDGRGP